MMNIVTKLQISGMMFTSMAGESFGNKEEGGATAILPLKLPLRCCQVKRKGDHGR